MPELPELEVYGDALRRRIVDSELRRVQIHHPFVLRTVDPSPCDVEGLRVLEIRRIGKRLALSLHGDLWLVLHLMRAGRLTWHGAGRRPPARHLLASFEFTDGVLGLVEPGSRKRASLHIARGRTLEGFNRGGVEVLDVDLATFSRALTAENHTLKRAITDPSMVSGIGNAYADEILHRAGLSPVVLTSRLSAGELERLFAAARSVLSLWIGRLQQAAGDGFPADLHALRGEMAVHGRFGAPCGVCGTPIQRIRYAEHETNYCAHCQTAGRLLADRSLSRLLKSDWPRTLEELEQLQTSSRPTYPAIGNQKAT